MGSILRRVAVLGVAGLVAASAWLVLRPPELIRVAAGYAVKIVCSNTVIAGRDPDQVLALDVQAPGHPLLRLMRVAVDRDARTVRAGLFGVAGDGRREIALADLLAMASGLAFDEDDGSVTDVTRMLYLEPDRAAFAAAKPLAHPVGSVFNYASGSSALLARLWQDAVGADALAWPRRALFEPLGMRSAVLEADARGSFVGSSYLYATARDWARFGQLLLQDGRWEGRAVLPPGWVARMFAPPASGPTEYSQGQMWLHGPAGRDAPAGQNPDAAFGLPADARWLLGHDGQAIAVVPSRQRVLVRLGLTPSRLGYRPQRLLRELLRALPPP
jgi:CubicO group peptidase (beta-lactamase class C family)